MSVIAERPDWFHAEDVKDWQKHEHSGEGQCAFECHARAAA